MRVFSLQGDCAELMPPTPPPRRLRLGLGGGCMSGSASPSPAQPALSFSRIASGLKLAQAQAMAVAGFLPADPDGVDGRHVRCSVLNHRASFHGRAAGEPNGHTAAERLSHSLPGSPADRRPPPFEVVGSAESLVGRVLAEQGLGKYCDPEFVRYTSREMQEALNMTEEEMDRAAHQLLQQEHCRRTYNMEPQL